MLLLASSLDSLNLPEPPLRNDEWKAPLPIQFRNGLADPLQLSPPTLKEPREQMLLTGIAIGADADRWQDFPPMTPLEI